MNLSLLKIILCGLVLITLNVSYTFANTYECEDKYEYLCQIYDVTLTRDDLVLDPIAKNTTAVENVELHGKIPVLSDENTGKICENFSNLQEIYCDNCKIEDIKANAFSNCHQLERLYLPLNNFQHFDKNSFEGLSKLKNIWIAGGNISLFESKLTDSKLLETLVLSNLNISIFSVEILREQKNLKTLDVSENNLYDLDVEKVLEFAPELEILALYGNTFKCSRLRKVVALLKEKNVSTNFLVGRLPTHSDHVEGMECLNDGLWEQEFQRFREQSGLDLPA